MEREVIGALILFSNYSKMFKKSKECLPWVQKTIHARFLVTVKSLLNSEKSFFFSPLRRSWRRPATVTEPSSNKLSEKKISGTQGKQAV